MLSKKFHEAAYQQKKPYLKFIQKLGAGGLSGFFKFPGEQFSLWWFSLIAEKSPGKTEVYEKLISLLINSEQHKRKKSLREKLSGCWILSFLKGCYSFCCFVTRVCVIKSALPDFKARVPALKLKKNIIVSCFPLIDKEKAKRDLFENKFIAPFHRLMGESFSGSYAHVCLQVDYDDNNLEDSIRQLKRFINKESIFLLEEFIKLADLGKVLFYYLYFSVISILNIPKSKKLFVYNYNSQQIKVWDLFKADYYTSFCGSALMSSLGHIFLFRRVFDYLDNNSKVVVVAEMHEWEKALFVSAKKKEILTIAFQHAHLPELLLNYFNDKEEINGSDFVLHCPLPDYLATVGDTAAGLFQEYGWPKERVFVWGAQRFEPLKLLRGGYYKKKENLFVCAFSMIPSEAQNVLLLLEQAFPDYPGYKIILKGHSLLNIQSIERNLKLRLNQETFEYSKDSLEKLSTCAQGMIVTGSSSCFYAMASGSQVIIPLFAGRLDLNPLSYISDIPFYVFSAQELRRICDSIINKTAPAVTQERFDTFLNRYFYFPDDDSEYMRKIDCLAKG